MTVQNEITTYAGRHEGYHCQWFAGKKLEAGSFPFESLKRAPDEEED